MAPGDYLITLTATDQLGLGAVPRGIILRIGTGEGGRARGGPGDRGVRRGDPTGGGAGGRGSVRGSRSWVCSPHAADRNHRRRQGPVQHRGGPCLLRGLERRGVPRPGPGIKFTFTGDVDTITGAGSSATLTGTGSYNGVSGHTFAITVGDNGAPGANRDSIDVVIRNAAGAVVFSSGRELLKSGNIVVTVQSPS